MERGYPAPGAEPGEGTPLIERMRQHGVPGLSVAVIHDGRLDWAWGWGVTEAGGDRPVTERTLFQAASISKPVAALAALRLVDRGVLDLDADVNGSLRSWTLPSLAASRPGDVTLRRILNHTAGLTVHGFRGYTRWEQMPTLEQVLSGQSPSNSAAVVVDLEPGSEWRYSGGGYTVLQQLLVDATGRDFPVLVKDLVLGPLEMTSSTFEQPLPASLEGRAAAGHYVNGAVVMGRWHTYPEMAAAGLWSTPSDLARFALAVQRAYRGKGESILSRSLAREKLRPGANNWGLGPALEGDRATLRFTHGGANQGFRAYLVMFLRKERGVVVMTNSDNGSGLILEVMARVAEVYGWDRF